MAISSAWHIFLARQGFGHEAWLSPHAYIDNSDMSVRTDIRIGQNFTGDGLRYLPQKIATLAFLTEDGQQAITGRLGDQPLFRQARPSGVRIS